MNALERDTQAGALTPAEFREHQDNWRQGIALYRNEKGKALAGNTLRVALAIQHYEHSQGGNQGLAWPTRGSLAVRAGINGSPATRRSEVTKHLTRLKAAGFIHKAREGVAPNQSNRNGTAAIWQLTIPPATQRQVRELFTYTEPETGTVDTNDRTGEQTDPGASGEVTTRMGGRATTRVGGCATTRVGGRGTHPTHSDYTPREHTLNTHPDSPLRFNSGNSATDQPEFTDTYNVSEFLGIARGTQLGSNVDYLAACHSPYSYWHILNAYGQVYRDEAMSLDEWQYGLKRVMSRAGEDMSYYENGDDAHVTLITETVNQVKGTEDTRPDGYTYHDLERVWNGSRDGVSEHEFWRGWQRALMERPGKQIIATACSEHVTGKYPRELADVVADTSNDHSAIPF